MNGMGERVGHGGLFFKNEEHCRKRIQKAAAKAGGGSPLPAPSGVISGNHTAAFRPPYVDTPAKQTAPTFRF